MNTKKQQANRGQDPAVFRNGDNGPMPKTRYSTIDQFNDLRAKHGAQGGNFFDWLRREREEKQNQTGG